MQILRNKTKMTATIVIVLLMASVMLMAMQVQPVQAQLAAVQPSVAIPSGVTPNQTFTTIAYVSFRPRPVGVGQVVLVNAWIQTETLSVAKKFVQSHRLTITDPNGTQDVITMDSYVADSTIWHEFIADQVGTWTIKFDFLGNYQPAGGYLNGYIVTNTSGTNFANSQYYNPASDGPYELVVQAEQVLSWPASPLPTDYWTRPVNPQT